MNAAVSRLERRLRCGSEHEQRERSKILRNAPPAPRTCRRADDRHRRRSHRRHPRLQRRTASRRDRRRAGDLPGGAPGPLRDSDRRRRLDGRNGCALPRARSPLPRPAPDPDRPQSRQGTRRADRHDGGARRAGHHVRRGRLDPRRGDPASPAADPRRARGGRHRLALPSGQRAARSAALAPALEPPREPLHPEHARPGRARHAVRIQSLHRRRRAGFCSRARQSTAGPSTSRCWRSRAGSDTAWSRSASPGRTTAVRASAPGTISGGSSAKRRPSGATSSAAPTACPSPAVRALRRRPRRPRRRRAWCPRSRHRRCWRC